MPTAASTRTLFAPGDPHRLPKLDNVDYAEKLTEILKQNDIQSVTVVRMEVPCCGGIENAVKRAMQASGKWIPWNVVTVRIDGTLME